MPNETMMGSLKRVYRELINAEERYADTVAAALPPGMVIWYMPINARAKAEGTVVCVNKAGKDTRVIVDKTPTPDIKHLYGESIRRCSINPACIIAPKEPT